MFANCFQPYYRVCNPLSCSCANYFQRGSVATKLYSLLARTYPEQQPDTTAQIKFVQAAKRLSSLRGRQVQCKVDLQRHEDKCQRQCRLQAQTTARQQENQAALLAISAVLAASYAAKEAAERKLADLTRPSEACRQERRHLLDQTQTVRSAWREQQEDVHARELQVAQLRHQAEALCARLQEDYPFDLADIYQRQLAAFPDDAAAEAGFANLLEGSEPIGEETSEVLAPPTRLSS